MEKKSYREQISEWIKEKRKKKGIKQEQLADKIGTTKQRISQFENRDLPSLEQCIQIGTMLGGKSGAENLTRLLVKASQERAGTTAQK